MEIEDIIELINNNQIRDLCISAYGKIYYSSTSIQATTLNEEIHKISVRTDNQIYNAISDLLNACATNTSLRTLDLPYCNFRIEEAFLIEIIQKHPSLEKINLYDNKLSEQLIGEIVIALQRGSPLKDLRFSGLTDKAIIAIAAALEDHPSFEALDLSCNHELSTSGMEALAKMIATNRSLKKINLNNCLQNHKSAQEMRLLLLKALASNPHSVLEKFDLCFPTHSSEVDYEGGTMEVDWVMHTYTDIPLSEEEMTVFETIHSQHLGLINITVYQESNNSNNKVIQSAIQSAIQSVSVVQTLMYILGSENLSDEVQEACYVLLGHHCQNKPDSMEFRVAILGLLKISYFSSQDTIYNLIGSKLVNADMVCSLLSQSSYLERFFSPDIPNVPIKNRLMRQYPGITAFGIFENFICNPRIQNPNVENSNDDPLFAETTEILKKKLANIQSTYLEKLQAAQQCIAEYTQAHDSVMFVSELLGHEETSAVVRALLAAGASKLDFQIYKTYVENSPCTILASDDDYLLCEEAAVFTPTAHSPRFSIQETILFYNNIALLRGKLASIREASKAESLSLQFPGRVTFPSIDIDKKKIFLETKYSSLYDAFEKNKTIYRAMIFIDSIQRSTAHTNEKSVLSHSNLIHLILSFYMPVHNSCSDQETSSNSNTLTLSAR